MTSTYDRRPGDLAALHDARIAIEDDRDRPRDAEGMAYITAGNWPARWSAALNLLQRLSDVVSPPRSPAPLTVADALRLPDVRSGAQWVEVWRDAWVRHYRVDGGNLCHRDRHGVADPWPHWCRSGIGLTDLDAPCTLVPADPGDVAP